MSRVPPNDALTSRMIQPTSQLSELLSQIDRNPKSVPVIHRAYATRRKNACGAIKILSSKVDNRLKMCWTVGVLDAISSVLNDVNAEVGDSYSINANREACQRMVSTLLNFAAHKKNRMLICSHGKLLQSMLHCINEDEGVARQGCCTVLFYLAKTMEARPLIVRCPGMIEMLSRVIDVPRVKSPCEHSPPGGEIIPSNIDESSSVSISDGSSNVSENNASLSSESRGEDVETEDDSVGKEITKMEISFQTPIIPQLNEIDYDADSNKFLHGARLSVLACLLCLVKHKENAVSFLLLSSSSYLSPQFSELKSVSLTISSTLPEQNL